MTLRALVVASAMLWASTPAAHAQNKRPSKGKTKPKSKQPAEDVLPANQPRPWAEGVSAANQKAALKIYESGNNLFVQKSYAEALKLYREAIALWDHPAIRFNMAECLVSLDQPLEAYENVISALRFGEPALGAEYFERATRTKQLLEGQVASIVVSCDEPGAIVTLDGKRLFVAPGKATTMLLPGAHQIVASKPGFITLTREEVALPHKAQQVELALMRLRSLEYRWARWKPWAVVGGGAAVALLGIVFRYQAQGSYDDFEQALAAGCPQGCTRQSLPPDVAKLETRADRMNALAVTGYSIGGAAIVAGLVLVLLNQERFVDEPLPVQTSIQRGGATWSVGWQF